MTISNVVGLKFREAMSGHVAPGARTPESGARTAKKNNQTFAFNLNVSIPRLNDFLNAGVHVMKVTGGTAYWKGQARRTRVARGGTVVMYRNVSSDGRRKVFDFTFSFKDSRGRTLTVVGEKRLYDDKGFDAAADLSTLFVTVHRDGQQVGAGITRVHVDEILDQIASMTVTRAANAKERRAANKAFLTFMNRQLSRVYKHLPPLFSADDTRYLTRSEWRALTLVATVMLPPELPRGGPTIRDVVKNLERFIRSADAAQLDQIRSRLRLLGTFAPILRGFVEGIRKWAAKTLAKPEPSTLRAVFEQMHQIAVLPYFAHPKADSVVGYKRPAFRPKYNTRLPIKRRPTHGRTFDVCIVGAGVAGSLLAERLTAKGKSVLLLEAGPYVAEKNISTDDLKWTAALYKRSGLQAANEDGPYLKQNGVVTVLQGACVGGGATVNNAICFQLPAGQLRKWQGLGFPIDAMEMRDAYAKTARELGIRPLSQVTRHYNPAGGFVTNAFGDPQIPDVARPPTEGFYECLVNLEGNFGCLGCGMCNTGCGSERKRNAMQVHLPKALSRDCELVPNARLKEIKLTSGSGSARRVSSLEVDVEGRTATVKAREVVLCAGAIGSSEALLASPDVMQVQRRLRLPIGKRFCANVGSPVFAFFDQVMHSRPTLQISHYYLPRTGDGYIIESWYAPPGSLAIAMPGFGDRHWTRMMAYQRALTMAPLVGSQAKGTITLGKDRRAKIRLPIGAFEVKRLRAGQAKLAEAFLAGSNGVKADTVVAGTRGGYAMKNAAHIRKYKRFLKSPTQLLVGTGHPQGGNAMSTRPELSVVDDEFKVRGIDNLRVCDASVFPMVSGVNPQWTVMAVADVCADRM